jgi:hypothetical protein
MPGLCIIRDNDFYDGVLLACLLKRRSFIATPERIEAISQASYPAFLRLRALPNVELRYFRPNEAPSRATESGLVTRLGYWSNAGLVIFSSDGYVGVRGSVTDPDLTKTLYHLPIPRAEWLDLINL